MGDKEARALQRLEAESEHRREEKAIELLQSAWVATVLERDKSLLTVSAGGIGLLVTLLSVTKPTGLAILLAYGVAFLGFTVAVVTAVAIFDRNAKHVERILAKQPTDSGRRLDLLDRIAAIGFIVGVLSSVIIGGITLLFPTPPSP